MFHWLLSSLDEQIVQKNSSRKDAKRFYTMGLDNGIIDNTSATNKTCLCHNRYWGYVIKRNLSVIQKSKVFNSISLLNMLRTIWCLWYLYDEKLNILWELISLTFVLIITIYRRQLRYFYWNLFAQFCWQIYQTR